jgi:hypothetical protein
VLALLDQGGAVGFSRVTLAGWVAFDALMAVLLFRFAHRPRPRALLLVTGLAGADAALSLRHLAEAGLPTPSWLLFLRGAMRRSTNVPPTS